MIRFDSTSINLDHRTFLFGQEITFGGYLTDGYDLQEFIEYLRGGKDLIMRIPGVSQVFRLDISGFDQAYALIVTECRRNHNP